jgi:peptidoglycan hydrolase-like protein with peptidoglycan-binding domain
MKQSFKAGTALVTAMAFAISIVGLSVPARASASPDPGSPVGAPTKVICTQPTVSMYKNKRHICVEYVQRMLNIVNGKDANLATDRKFGTQTYKAVLKFQANERKKDKKMAVDGVVGPQTWDKLCSYQSRYPDSFTKEAGC